MKKMHMLFVGAIGLLLLGAACSKNTNSNTNTEENTNTAVENENVNTSTVVNTNSVSVNVNRSEDQNTNSSEDSSSNTNTSSDHQQVSNGTLKVTSPETNAEVQSPIELEGKSSSTKVFVRAKSSTGSVMFTEPVTVRDGEFHVNLTVTLTNSKTITLEVFEKDAAGNEVNLVSVPVKVKVETSGETSANTNTSDTGNSNSNENDNTNTSGDNANVSNTNSY